MEAYLISTERSQNPKIMVKTTFLLKQFYFRIQRKKLPLYGWFCYHFPKVQFVSCFTSFCCFTKISRTVSVAEKRSELKFRARVSFPRRNACAKFCSDRLCRCGAMNNKNAKTFCPTHMGQNIETVRFLCVNF